MRPKQPKSWLVSSATTSVDRRRRGHRPEARAPCAAFSKPLLLKRFRAARLFGATGLAHIVRHGTYQKPYDRYYSS
jgi:hypothetical protein